MANLLSTIYYVTIADARETSAILRPIGQNELTSLLAEAEIVVDNYIGFYWVKADEDQVRIFPVEDEEIPDDIKIATLWIAEQIFLEWSGLGVLRWDKIVSEGNMSRSVSFSNKETHKEFVDTIQIPKKALRLLDRYKTSFISQII